MCKKEEIGLTQCAWKAPYANCSSQETIHKLHFWLYIRIPFCFPVYITFALLSHNWLLAPNSSQTFSAPSSFNTYFPDLQPNAPLPSTGLWHFVRELWVIKRCNEYVFARSLSVDSFINKRVSHYSKESLASLPCLFRYLASAT